MLPILVCLDFPQSVTPPAGRSFYTCATLVAATNLFWYGHLHSKRLTRKRVLIRLCPC